MSDNGFYLIMNIVLAIFCFVYGSILYNKNKTGIDTFIVMLMGIIYLFMASFFLNLKMEERKDERTGDKGQTN